MHIHTLYLSIHKTRSLRRMLCMYMSSACSYTYTYMHTHMSGINRQRRACKEHHALASHDRSANASQQVGQEHGRPKRSAPDQAHRRQVSTYIHTYIHTYIKKFCVHHTSHTHLHVKNMTRKHMHTHIQNRYPGRSAERKTIRSPHLAHAFTRQGIVQKYDIHTHVYKTGICKLSKRAFATATRCYLKI
jgi:hypothetical protein